LVQARHPQNESAQAAKITLMLGLKDGQGKKAAGTHTDFRCQLKKL
jgi:hypothetical protein